MKKLIYSVIALAAVAVGCTKSEMIETPDFGGQAITFDTYIGKVPTTKAQSVDLAYLQDANKGFHVSAFMHDQNAVPAPASITDPYMDKDVWWEGAANETNIPNETATTKVIFATQTGDSAPSAPSITAATYDAFACPTGWSDFPTSESTHYVVCTYNAPSEGVNAGSWSVGTVTAITKFSNANGTWEYDGVTYWPDANSQTYLAFVAYGVNVKTTSDEIVTWGNSNITTKADKSEIDFTVADKVENQTDLIVAPYQSGKILNANSSNTTVALNFKHVLSRIGFKLVANQNNAVEIIVKSVQMKGNFAKTGTVDLMQTTPVISQGTPELVTYDLFPTVSTGNPYCFKATASTNATSIFANATYAQSTATNKPSSDYVTATSVSEAAAATNNANRYMMLMPSVAAGNYEIIVQYQLADSAPESAKVTLSSWSFLPGKAYEFVLKVSTSKVGFYVEVSDWEPGSGVQEYVLTPDTPSGN